MKLYHSSGSPNSRRVRILIAEKGLDIELAPVDLGAKEQFSERRQRRAQALVRYRLGSSECNCLEAIDGGCDGHPRGNKETLR